MTQTTPQSLQTDAAARLQGALETTLAKIKQDPYVLAVVLYGSLAYDAVWEKSDIDLMIVTQETRLLFPCITLTESGVNIHATLITRSEFKKQLGGAVQGSFTHSMLMKGRLVFTRDESLEELWENRQSFGAKDRETHLLQISIPPLMCLAKAQKWLLVRNDPCYSFFWIMKCLDGLADIETTLAGEIPGREALLQAVRINPSFFNALYTELIDAPKTPQIIGDALKRIEEYLRERAVKIFAPLLEYLADSGSVRSAREIDHYFQKQRNVEFAYLACEWLAEEGYIKMASASARLTEKSRVDVEEVAYYYDGAPS